MFPFRPGNLGLFGALLQPPAPPPKTKCKISKHFSKVSHYPSAAETLCCTSFPSFNTGMRNMASVNDTFEVRVIIWRLKERRMEIGAATSYLHHAVKGVLLKKKCASDKLSEPLLQAAAEKLTLNSEKSCANQKILTRTFWTHKCKNMQKTSGGPGRVKTTCLRLCEKTTLS